MHVSYVSNLQPWPIMGLNRVTIRPNRRDLDPRRMMARKQTLDYIQVRIQGAGISMERPRRPATLPSTTGGGDVNKNATPYKTFQTKLCKHLGTTPTLVNSTHVYTFATPPALPKSTSDAVSARLLPQTRELPLGCEPGKNSLVVDEKSPLQSKSLSTRGRMLRG